MKILKESELKDSVLDRALQNQAVELMQDHAEFLLPLLDELNHNSHNFELVLKASDKPHEPQFADVNAFTASALTHIIRR